MARINQGSCVGIFYWEGNQIAVHNGRLIAARYGNSWVPYVDTSFGQQPDEVLFSHLNITANTRVPFQERRSLTRIVEVRLTPDLPMSHPFYCATFRGPGRQGEIRPGTCVGVYFTNEQTGIRDVKNGRYLYWLDEAGQRHCVLLEGANPPAVVYAHWNVKRNNAGQITGLESEAILRTRVHGVFRLTL